MQSCQNRPTYRGQKPFSFSRIIAWARDGFVDVTVVSDVCVKNIFFVYIIKDFFP